MTPTIIIGLKSQGLSVLRMLSKGGDSVIAFTNTKKSVGFYSKYGEKQLFTSVDDLKYQIKEIVNSYNETLTCIITSGKLLALIIRKFPDLYDLCNVEPRPLSIVKVLSNKNTMYQFAQKRGLQTASFQLLSDYRNNSLSFPVIVKKNFEIPLFFKVLKVDTERQLFELKNEIDDKNIKDIIVQEYIDTSQYKFITYQAYISEGNILAELYGEQVRRLSIGLTSCVKKINDDFLGKKILEESKNLLEGLIYSGFLEIEYLYDPKGKKLMFMEINARPCGTHSAFEDKYENLSVLYGSNQKACLIERNKDLSWINFARDIKVRFKEKDFQRISDFFVSTFDVFDLNDLKPFIMQFFKR